MTKRTCIPTTSPYAEKLGFSRAVRIGNHIAIAGTAALADDGSTVGIGDPGAQTRRCIEIIEQALNAAGAELKDVVRTRIMLTDINDWPAVAEIKNAYFKDIKPVDTVVEVSGFIKDEWLVEIEVDAIIL